MTLTKLALLCAVLITGQAPGDVMYTNLRSGKLGTNIDPQRAAEIRELMLFISPDRGKTWNEIDKITPDKEGFSYFTPGDGEYWFHVVVVNQQGKQEPADLYKTPPMTKLIVDTKPPELKITSAARQGDDLMVSWSVREDNPDPPKLKLEYRQVDSSIWVPIPLTPSPQGTAKTRLNTAAPVVVRLQFSDRANNSASVESQVSGGLAAASFNANVAPPKAPEEFTPPPVPPVMAERPALPPSPPGSDMRTTGSVIGMPQPPTVAARPPAIASSTDYSQGSPVPAQPGVPPPQRSMPAIQVVNDPEIVLEYEVAKVGPSGLGRIEVWLTRDSGSSWVRFAEDPDASQAINGGQYKRTLTLPGEGVYGISMVVKSKAGLGKPAPRPGDVPEMLVEVDQTQPEAMLFPLVPDPLHRDTILLQWAAKDRNLGEHPITLEWAERSNGPWLLIAGNLQNSGRYAWQLPRSLPPQVYFKLTVQDSAGNMAVAITHDPQLVDLSEPEGRLLRVLPANKHQ